MRINLSVSKAEHELIKARAGHEPVSTYCKRIVLASSGEVIEDQPKVSRVRLPVAGEANASKHSRNAKACIHGTSKGYNCWQCGGMAKIAIG
jgi:hypothetical protein